jgi:hypothetical protein
MAGDDARVGGGIGAVHGVSYAPDEMAAMTSLYTKNGRPLQVSGDKVYSRSGAYAGRIKGGKVYDPRGSYAGSIVGDRIVYRSTDSASISGPSVSASRVGSARANAASSAVWGDEPNFPD